MNCGDFQTQIGDAIDGTLDAGARAALDAHLTTCDTCRAVRADLQRIRSMAAMLDAAPPPPSVWPRIAAAVDAQHTRRTWWSWIAMPTWRPALAAALLIAIMAGGTWAVWRRLSPAPAPTSSDQRTAANAQAAATAENEIQQAEEHYNKAIASLEQAAKTDSGALDAQTTAVLQNNLGVIDSAIGESRQALHADPSNEVARQSLFDALRSKVTLLEDTVALINEMRKGNQEGAARIVSGMKP